MVPNIRLISLGDSEHIDTNVFNVFEKRLQGWKGSDQMAAGTLSQALLLQLRLACMLSNKYYTL